MASAEPDPAHPAHPGPGGAAGAAEEPAHRSRSMALAAGGLLLTGFLVYTAFAGERPVQIQRGVPFALAAALAFWAVPLRAPRRWPYLRGAARGVDLLLITGAASATAYLVSQQEAIALRLGLPTTADIAFAGIGILVTLEMTRRTLGLALPLIGVGFLGYAMLGSSLPFGLGHSPMSLDRVLIAAWYGSDGVFGIPFGVMVNTIFLFLIFGALLKELGIAESFLNLVYVGARRLGGGAGLSTVGGSLAFGSVSGSGVADAAAVGTFTIPMMRRAGYQRETAAVIQGVAAIGAQLVPPVMGASAFVIAALVGVPYLEVVAIAIVPAALYYLCVVLVVLGRSDAEQVGSTTVEPVDAWRRTILDSLLFVVVVAWLIIRLANDVNPQAAVAEACALTIGVGLLRKSTRPTPARVATAVRRGTRSSLGLFAATAVVGVIVAVSGMTGIGNQVAELAGRLAGESLFLALLFTAVASIVLGTGLPTVAAYLLLAVLAAPALGELGVPLLIAHFFIFFYGVTSDLSPPTALAPVAAAGVAGADVQKTMWRTLKYGLPIFFIPFILVLRPGTMLDGGAGTIAVSIGLAIVYVAALTIGMGGHWRGRLSRWSRLLLVIGGFGILVQDDRALIGALAAIVAAIVVEKLHRRGRAGAATGGRAAPVSTTRQAVG